MNIETQKDLYTEIAQLEEFLHESKKILELTKKLETTANKNIKKEKLKIAASVVGILAAFPIALLVSKIPAIPVGLFKNIVLGLITGAGIGGFGYMIYHSIFGINVSKEGIESYSTKAEKSVKYIKKIENQIEFFKNLTENEAIEYFAFSKREEIKFTPIQDKIELFTSLTKEQREVYIELSKVKGTARISYYEETKKQNLETKENDFTN